MSKDRHSRREFLGMTGAGLAGAAALPLLGATSGAQTTGGNPRDADLVVFNAKVYTVDRAQPKAEAFAVKAGRFVAVGSSAEIKGLAGKGTQSYDAKGMTVVPGAIDCHNHVAGNEVLYSVLCGNPFVVQILSISEIVDRLRKAAQKTKRGDWVVGTFFDDTKVKEKREINVHDLDQASREVPIVVHDRGGHTAFYNSKAFELAGITKNTPNPFGGTFGHFPNGDLDGRVSDNAMQSFRKVDRQPTYTADQTLQRDRDGLAYMSKKFVRYGVTSVCHESGDLRALQQVRARGDLLHRVSFETRGDLLEAMIANGIMSGFGDERIRFGATSEHTIDGSFSERTMSLSMGYPDNRSYHGNIRMKQPDLNEWVERVHHAGIQVNCHANGDTAIDMYLTALEAAFKKYPRPDARPKITHCTLINPDLVRRIKALGATPALFYTYPYFNGDKFHFYGKQIMSHALAFKTLLGAGIRACGGSDFPPGPFDPRMGIQGMVTRTGFNGETWGANNAITVDQALEVLTLNGAYDTHEEKIKGSITPGKLADYVVWAEDPHTIDQSKIKDIEIVRTVVGGATVYQA